MRRRVPSLIASRPTWRTVRLLAWASVVANVVIVVTGGAVRLTASGLGCPTWPKCGEESYVTHGELGIHGAIEFGNRLLTFVLAAVAIATLVAAVRARPRRSGPVRIAMALFLGIPLQAVIGGITVLTKLNPWVVMLHFLLSMVLVGLATLLVQRTGEGDGPARLVVHPMLHRLGLAILGLTAVVLYLGTVVTGSGPHAGDLDAKRTGLDPDRMSQLHADGVFLMVGLTLAMVFALAAVNAPAQARRAAVVLLGVELAQGVVGFVQFFTGLPEVLVALHMLGAGVTVVAAVRLVLALRVRAAELPEPRRPAVAAVPASAAVP
ncbi:COX15/CtaA family protein [Motilibacter deserti]|uniref:Heme A synthase n=1 Tax=Motilibacter deserti TaxID=2714956 RepID=A0ABX0GNY7_9ACTN|nr:heme A synthase [Motilibacter deserti]